VSAGSKPCLNFRDFVGSYFSVKQAATVFPWTLVHALVEKEDHREGTIERDREVPHSAKEGL
jgi:hypothetical protein